MALSFPCDQDAVASVMASLPPNAFSVQCVNGMKCRRPKCTFAHTCPLSMECTNARCRGCHPDDTLYTYMRRNFFFVKEVVVEIEEADEPVVIDIPVRDAEDEAIDAICAQASHQAVCVENRDVNWQVRERQLKIRIASAISRANLPTTSLGEADMELEDPDDFILDLAKMSLCA